MRILVVGVTGMLGNALLRVLATAREHQIYGTLRGDRVSTNRTVATQIHL